VPIPDAGGQGAEAADGAFDQSLTRCQLSPRKALGHHELEKSAKYDGPEHGSAEQPAHQAGRARSPAPTPVAASKSLGPKMIRPRDAGSRPGMG
jgi:hypothetical protein